MSLIFASLTVGFFYTKNIFSSRILNNFFRLNVFFASNIFAYEIISKHYTDKNKLANIDTYLYIKNKL